MFWKIHHERHLILHHKELQQRLKELAKILELEQGRVQLR